MAKRDNIQDVAVDFVKERKNVTNVSVIAVEQVDGIWVVRGTCPIDLGGHPWRESFEIKIDKKGEIKDSHFRLM